ncbi:DCC1-like thiol-disulfide oxidoreductase family protein [Paracoccus spongiarum]|uniref:DCC1-like thiol-disulfide oxidoreductase family protein n=1 Tax=Paracoccus spongiarum TaxID=3064387 RepID=A0ABT9JCC9_9RHOB|nr:DCC1-like thiol-disulfide oxidoreductase family protein [Paracoccus sp. 2205BS29-5]MDP5307439.1 DCC1-like thiol-disulfide oxidoreductase family protein [Paracoccus sp. 2205BS29-5]
MTKGITIIYDGQCPFCASYVAMMRLRETVGPVALLDARGGDPRVAAALRSGLDLDAGMVAIWQGRQFHGPEAVHLLAVLSGPAGLLNGLQRRLFLSPRRAARVYPLLARGRRLFLRLSGRPPISGPAGTAPDRE